MLNIFRILFGAGLFSWIANVAKASIPPNNNQTTVNKKKVSLIDQRDLDVLARTLWGEARNEGSRGMQAVANVVMNRVKSSRWPSSAATVCMQPAQFSAWNKNDPNRPLMLAVTSEDRRFRMAIEIAEMALLGNLADITGGADHYLNVSFTREIRGGSLPSWADLNKKTIDIGLHTFLRLS